MRRFTLKEMKEFALNNNLESFIGKKYGKLTIKRIWSEVKGRSSFVVLCDCSCDCGGNIYSISFMARIQNGNNKSCGCLSLERLIKYNKENKKKENKYNLTNSFGVGYTSSGKEFYFDLEDYEKIKDYSWAITRTGYVYTTYRQDDFIKNGSKEIREHMHHILLIPREGFVNDHINGNRADNRKCNLRYATISQNNMNTKQRKDNTSGVKGVVYYRKGNVWNARIDKNKKRIRLGNFKNILDAIVARLLAEKEFFGEFAPQRHLFQKYGIEE